MVDPAETRSLLDEDRLLEDNFGPERERRPRVAMEGMQPDMRAPQAQEEEEEEEEEEGEEEEEDQEEQEERASGREGEGGQVEFESSEVEQELHCPSSPSTPSPTLSSIKVSLRNLIVIG